MVYTALVIGASRGLGLELAKTLHTRGHKVFATTRSPPSPSTFPEEITVIPGIDVGEGDAGTKIVEALGGAKVDVAIINAGLFKPETLDEPKYEDEVQMYKTVAIGPVFLTHHLYKSHSFAPTAKLILITSEGGCITLRSPEEGGGHYGHHGSKAAANMVGKLLAGELKEKGVIVTMIHPGFMRTEMTKAVGYDSFYDEGGAVTPAEAAKTTLDFIDKITPADSGKLWAPGGPVGIPQAPKVMGKDLPTPLELPW